MADPVLSTLFVVPTANTLPTSGTTAGLTSGQFGIFLPDYSPATVPTVASAKYIFLAQGRNVYAPGQIPKQSDKIYAENVVQWYKVTGSLSANNQVTVISGLTAGCNENVSITLRLFSYYPNSTYYNGLTRSVMITTACCDCGDNPCSDLGASDTQAAMQALAQAINDDEILSQLVTAGTNGTGLSTSIYIQGQPVQVYGQGTSADPTNYPYQYDRLYFYTYVYSGPELTTDYNVINACETVATATLLQRATYAPEGTPAQIKTMEIQAWGEQNTIKSIFANPNFNGEYTTYVDSTGPYDLYYLNYWHPTNDTYSMGYQKQGEWSCIAIPQGATSQSGMEAILTAFLGSPDDKGTSVTTSTTYTTSSTTSTTTTLVTP